MIGRATAWFFCTARDALARVLVRLGVTPNGLTVAGTVFVTATGVCYALGAGDGFALSLKTGHGRSAWPLLAALGIIAASACDMLDGAVARLGGKGSRFGAFLDSTLDRYSDFTVYAGIALYYASASPANVTFVLAAMLAFFNGFMISYAKARAEDLIDACPVGYWQRGERSAAVLIATFGYNMPALLTQQALLPMLTAWRRISYTGAVLAGRPPVTDVRQGGFWLKIRLWRWPRMSWPYDLVTGINIAWLIFARLGEFDPLGGWLRG